MLRQEQLSSKISKVTNNCWGFINTLRSNIGHKWPDECHIPVDAILLNTLTKEEIHIRNTSNTTDIQNASQAKVIYLRKVVSANILASFAAWRLTKLIYRFDKDLLSEIVKTELTKFIHTEIYARLPTQCIYIELQHPIVKGFYVNKDVQLDNNDVIKSRLQIILDTDDLINDMNSPIFHITTYKSMEENIDRINETLLNRDNGDLFIGLTQMALATTLYICSMGADIRGPQIPKIQEKKTKKGIRTFPANKDSVYEVGFRIGAALRKAKAEIESCTRESIDGERSSLIPHIRRAHWHTFMTGNRKGTQIPVVKWLPPIPVNLEWDEVEEKLVTTIRPVKK